MKQDKNEIKKKAHTILVAKVYYRHFGYFTDISTTETKYLKCK